MPPLTFCRSPAGEGQRLGAFMTDADLQQAFTMREIVRAYGTAVHVATTLQPPPSPVRVHQRIAESEPPRRSSLLKQTAVRFIAWFG
jgi:hypothetical protein